MNINSSALRAIASISGAVSQMSGLQRLSILIYHRVLNEHDPLMPAIVDSTTFDWHMKLASRYYNVLSLDEAVLRLKGGTLPKSALCITFDDGYADNYDVALPILKKYSLPATFFVATKFLDGQMMWNDSVIESIRRACKGTLSLEKAGLEKYQISDLASRQDAIHKIINSIKYLPLSERADKVALINEAVESSDEIQLMMSRDQVARLSESGMIVGGHTVTHPILSQLSYDEAVREIDDGKKDLEEITGKNIEFFAYPNGKPGTDYREEHSEIVKELGFKAAVSTKWGVSTRNTSIYELRRFTPWDKTPTAFLLRGLKNYFNN